MTRLCLVGLFALTLLGCAAPTLPPKGPVPSSVAAPQVKVGDFWEYAVRDAYTQLPFGTYRYEVTRVDGQGVAVDVKRNGALIDTFFYAPDWNPREMPLRNVQRLRFQTPFPAYPYPLEPGKTWHTVVKAFDPANGKTYNVHVQGKVMGWERVNVPAGEFDALRVRRYIFAGNAEWFQSQEEIIEHDWYVPSVGRSVREEGKSQHVDHSRSEGGAGDGGGMPMIVRGDWLIADLVRFSR